MSWQVEVAGLKELRRDLRAIDTGLPKALADAMVPVAERTVLPRAKELAPERTGALRGSLGVRPRGSGVAVVSRLPYANVVHWGGTTGRGHQLGPGRGATRVRASKFVVHAGEEQLDRFAGELGVALDGFFGRHGF